MKFLLPLWSSNDMSDVSYAAVEIDDAFRAWLLDRRNAAVQLKKLDDQFWWLTYANAQPEFYRTLPDHFTEVAEEADSGPCPLDGTVEIPEGDVRIEYALIHIDERHVFWTVREKHSTIEAETAALDFDDLEHP